LVLCINFVASTHGLGSGINLSIVAMALAGINTANNALWLSKCRELYNKIDNPYLRATFAFLTCGTNYKQIIVGLRYLYLKSLLN